MAVKDMDNKTNDIVRVGLIQQANTGDIAGNRARLCEKMRRLAADGASLIVNQELHDSLYFCQTESTDLCDLAVAIPSEVTDTYAALAKELGVVIVTSLFERRAPGLYHNTAVVFERDGSVAGIYRKMLLTMRSSILLQEILVLSRLILLWGVWVCLSAGINGILRQPVLWLSEGQKSLSILQLSVGRVRIPRMKKYDSGMHGL